MNEARNPARATSRGVLIALASLGAAQMLWATFQWRELLVLRAGGITLCDQTGGHCAEAWDSAFASSVHQLTGVPIAGWGVVWGGTALVLALALAWSGVGRARVLRGAIRALALGGMIGVAVLGSALASSGAWCVTCVVSYALVAAYACVAWFAPLGAGSAVSGLGIAALAAAAVFLLALVPGLRTPRIDPRPLEQEIVDEGPLTARLESFIAALPEQAKQSVANEVDKYRNARSVRLPEARGLIGPSNAVVRVTEFHDPLCPHCARLHQVLEHLRERLPEGQLAIDPHHYPLDSDCNSSLSSPGRGSVRCAASKAFICMEGEPGAFAFAGAVFAHQSELDAAKLYDLAEPYMSRSELRRCIESGATAQRLQDDIDWAVREGIRGTPFVFLNGKQLPGYAPLVFALVLAGGDPDHPGLAGLPEPETEER